MTAPLWTAAEAARATGGTAQGTARGEWRATGVAIDTREMAPGDLFVALSGENRDGHAFVAQALAGGAAAAMVSRVPEGVPVDAPLLLVDDTLAALGRLGAAGRARTGARVIAVTGSVGKTSTKEMLRSMLAGQGPTHAATRSFNNHWGVPLTLGADACRDRLCRGRDRHEPCRARSRRCRAWRARMSRWSRPSSRCTWSIWARSRRLPTPRPRSSPGSRRRASPS